MLAGSRMRIERALSILLVACSSVSDEDAPSSGGSSGAPGGGGGADAITTGGSGGSGLVSDAGGSGGEGGEMGTAGHGGAGGSEVIQFDPFAGPLQNLTRVNHGTVLVSDTFSLQVPSGTLGITWLAHDATNLLIGFYKIAPPTGSSAAFKFSLPGRNDGAFIGPTWAVAAAPLTNSADAMPVQVGTWEITMGGESDASGKPIVVESWVRRTVDGEFHGGEMDLNVFISEGVTTTDYVSGLLGQMFPYAGIELGDVALYQAPSGAAVVTDYDHKDAILASLSPSLGPAVNVVIVDDFANDVWGIAIGASGGIPGSAVRHGTLASGILMQVSGDAAYDARVLSHEMGHLAGLFHTTELTGGNTDYLTDTPICPTDTIASDMWSCPDKANMMFPTASASPKAFSAAQERVIWGSGLYRGRTDEGEPIAAAEVIPKIGDGPVATRAALVPLSSSAAARATPVTSFRQPSSLLERVLWSHWCSFSANEFAAWTLRHGTPKQLERVWRDRTAPTYARARALSAELAKSSPGLVATRTGEVLAGAFPEALRRRARAVAAK